MCSEPNARGGEHYRTQVLCRVSQTLGKSRKILGKLLAECSTRRSAHGLFSTGETGFAECLFLGTRQTFAVCQAALGKKKLKRDGQQQTGERNGRTGRTNGTGSKTSPSARRVALGKDSNFAECQAGSTRRSFELCRVLPHWHSAKFGSLPSATRLPLGNYSNFAECLSKCTRRNLFQ